MIAALGWGALAASSVLLGALLGVARSWPRRPLGLLLGFGAGALISAISFELFDAGFRRGGGNAVSAGIAAGALTYFTLDRLLTQRHGGSSKSGGSSLALGAFLDGIPEQLALGLGLAEGKGIGVGLLVAVFVSNLPESIGSASEARESGQGRRSIVLLWMGVMAISTLATLAGYSALHGASGNVTGAIQGFAAGALLVMLADTMIPDANRRAGTSTGLMMALGFTVAAAISYAS